MHTVSVIIPKVAIDAFIEPLTANESNDFQPQGSRAQSTGQTGTCFEA